MNDKKNQKTGCFYLVGMGTHPDLITVRGARVVERADILILKQAEELEGWKEWIQNQEIWFLDHESRVGFGIDAEKIADFSLKQMAERYEGMRREIIERITEAVQAGKTVAYLENGDPMMFGATFLLELLSPEVPSEVIPGVSAHQAGCAALKMSPPYGWDTSGVILTMGDWAGRRDTNEQLMRTQSSMIFYSIHVDYPQIFSQLALHYPSDTPVAVVAHAGDPAKQAILRSTVGRFLEEVDYERLPIEKHTLFVGKFLKVGQARKGNMLKSRLSSLPYSLPAR